MYEDNKKLKAYVVSQRRYIKMLENVDQEQLNKSNILGLKSQGEGSIVPILKTKIRLLNDELDQLKDEQTNQNRSVKLTKTKELEQQLKRYQDEVIRLSYLLKNTLKISDQE